MKKKILLLFFCTVMHSFIKGLSVTSKGTKKVPLVVVGAGNDASELKMLCNTIERDLNFTGQFDVTTDFLKEIPTKKKIEEMSDTHALAVVVTSDGKKEKMEWRLYDTHSTEMKCGKSVKKCGNEQKEWGHFLSDGILFALTGRRGFFASKIVFCRQTKQKTTDICIMDYDGASLKTVVSLDSLAIAPRWNNDIIKPLVLYSEYTPTNVRLMVSNLQGKTSVASDFDGLNMLPAFSEDGADVILCLSVEGNSQIYRYVHYAKKNKGKYIPLTNNKGNNISPIVLPDSTIVFCSDFETKKPQIYQMDSNGKNVTCLTDGGFCTSPSYCSTNNKLVYIKNTGGRGQVVVYDMTTKQSTQITHDQVHKEECCWSPCGNYILFATDDGNKRRLAQLNLVTNKRIYLTDGSFEDGYPSWSHYPIIQ